jgi:hypothetical protein
MDGAVWMKPGSPELSRALSEVWGLASRTLQPYFPPGVYKHRTLESMNAQQEAWDQANFEAYLERRARLKASSSED